MRREPFAGRVVAIEEHFWNAGFAAHSGEPKNARPASTRERLEDFGGIRLREMDDVGIDVQVISHVPPGGQRLPADIAVSACRTVNDHLARSIAIAPDRFAGFAALPTADPSAAADELRRTVEELGFKGAMLHGLSNGRFMDDRDFWPIFAQAEALDVPIYLHPAQTDPTVSEIYYGAYARTHPMLARTAWGFGVETGTQAIRLVLSGVFEAHPGLKIILGHLGESIPFQLARIDEALSRPGNEAISFATVFRKNFYVTTSGFFSDPALRCCIDELGLERVLFAVDWPAVHNRAGVDWLSAFPLDPAGKAKIFSGNADALLRLGMSKDTQRPASAGRLR
jgi:predicted TIM-barrel fold metal-dependent hydrolase